MLTTMAQSGYTDEQIELFVVNSQKIPKLPDDESPWPISSACEADMSRTSHSIPVPSADLESGPSKSSHRKPGIISCWPPTDWKTCPDFEYSRRQNLRTRPNDCSQVGFSRATDDVAQIEAPISGDITGEWSFEEVSLPISTSILQDSGSIHCQPSFFAAQNESSALDCPVSEATDHSVEHFDISCQRRHLERIYRPTPEENLLHKMTGRLGEMLAYKYYTEKLGCVDVSWVNEEAESGLPYDLVIGEDKTRHYVEVKATKSASKDWFDITTREWEFAFEKKESYSIVHVAIMGTDKANITVLTNPYKLCRQNVLSLALLMFKRRN